MTLPVSELHSVGDITINQFGADGGMRVGRGNDRTQRKSAAVPFCPQHFLLEYRKRAAGNNGIL
jgi:hypothetical protein